MKIESKDKNIILLCSEQEAEIISAVLKYDREDCPIDCPCFNTNTCRLTWRADHWEECAALSAKIEAFLTLKKEGVL